MPKRPNRNMPVVRRQYRRLIEALAERVGGKRRGWQRRVAAILGISPAMLSNVLTKPNVVIGDEVLARAAERLGVAREDFFDDLDHWRAHLEGPHIQRLIDEVAGRPTPKRRRPAGSAPDFLPGLVAVHRWLLDRLEVSIEGGSITLRYDAESYEELAGELARELLRLPFIGNAVRLQDERTPETARATFAYLLINAFEAEVNGLRAWFRAHPDEPTISDRLRSAKTRGTKEGG